VGTINEAHPLPAVVVLPQVPHADRPATSPTEWLVTEAQWLAATDPEPLLAALQAGGKGSQWKRWLFAAAFQRAHSLASDADLAFMARWHEPMADVSERYADGLVTWSDMLAVIGLSIFPLPLDKPHDVPWPALRPPKAARIPTSKRAVEDGRVAALLRDVVGPVLFRDVPIDPGWLTWNDGTVVRLAASAYEERVLPTGTMDAARLGVLADALEEAGCRDAEILGHLREQGGVHVRGCWAVDLLLGKE
jgi:hypothetical protein